MDNSKNKVSTSITLEFNNLNYVRELGLNLSDWVNKMIENNLKNKQKRIEELKIEIEEKQLLIKRLELDIINENKKMEENIKNLTKEQISDIKETIRLIKERGDYLFEGRYKRYKNQFNHKISEEEFIILLEAFGYP